MTFNDVLLVLLAHLRAENKPIIIGWDDVQQWPEGTLSTLLGLGFLIPASAAQSIECHACENHCFMDVITLAHAEPDLIRAFIVCDDVDMQSEMGRVQIPLIRLQQWQVSVKQLSQVMADLLGLADKIAFAVNDPVIKLGMLKAPKGRRWVTLNSLDLSLEINKHSVPIDDVLYFEGEQLVVDQDAIDDLLSREPLTQGKPYTLSTNQREASKLKTQAMYKDWSDAYLRLKKQHPTKSNKWCSLQIAKMDIANAKDAETIRKNMVK
jgi:hypothetical protein